MSFLDDVTGGVAGSMDPGASADSGEPFEMASSPVAIVGVAALLLIAGLLALVFWGLTGAVVGYVAALVSFVLILVFRRRDSVLRQSAIVISSPSVDRGVPVLTIATVVVMAVSVWIVATEVSRTV